MITSIDTSLKVPSLYYIPENLQEDPLFVSACELIDLINELPDPHQELYMDPLMLSLVRDWEDLEALSVYFNVMINPLIGTKEAIELVLKLLKLKGRVVEWFDLEGMIPYKFVLFLEGNFPSGIDFDKLIDLIAKMRNERSRLSLITQEGLYCPPAVLNGSCVLSQCASLDGMSAAQYRGIHVKLETRQGVFHLPQPVCVLETSRIGSKLQHIRSENACTPEVLDESIVLSKFRFGRTCMGVPDVDYDRGSSSLTTIDSTLGYMFHKGTRYEIGACDFVLSGAKLGGGTSLSSNMGTSGYWGNNLMLSSGTFTPTYRVCSMQTHHSDMHTIDISIDLSRSSVALAHISEAELLSSSKVLNVVNNSLKVTEGHKSHHSVAWTEERLGLTTADHTSLLKGTSIIGESELDTDLLQSIQGTFVIDPAAYTEYYGDGTLQDFRSPLLVRADFHRRDTATEINVGNISHGRKSYSIQHLNKHRPNPLDEKILGTSPSDNIAHSSSAVSNKRYKEVITLRKHDHTSLLKGTSVLSKSELDTDLLQSTQGTFVTEPVVYTEHYGDGTLQDYRSSLLVRADLHRKDTATEINVGNISHGMESYSVQHLNRHRPKPLDEKILGVLPSGSIAHSSSTVRSTSYTEVITLRKHNHHSLLKGTFTLDASTLDTDLLQAVQFTKSDKPLAFSLSFSAVSGLEQSFGGYYVPILMTHTGLSKSDQQILDTVPPISVVSSGRSIKLSYIEYSTEIPVGYSNSSNTLLSIPNYSYWYGTWSSYTTWDASLPMIDQSGDI